MSLTVFHVKKTGMSPPESPRRYTLAGLGLVLALWLGNSGETHAVDQLFGHPETQHEANERKHPKWSGMLERATQDGDRLAICRPDFFNACFQNKLRAILPKIRKLSPLDQLNSVNKAINQGLKYAEDYDTWLKRDYWAARWEFYGKNQGDCEDYAIAKYFTLKELGFPVENMRVVAVWDESIEIGHAILMVELGQEAWILDNRDDRIRSHTDPRFRWYTPYYSVNEYHWWRHVRRVDGQPRTRAN